MSCALEWREQPVWSAFCARLRLRHSDGGQILGLRRGRLLGAPQLAPVSSVGSSIAEWYN